MNAPSVVSPFPFGREGKFGSLTLEPRGGADGRGLRRLRGLGSLALLLLVVMDGLRE